LNNPKRGNLTSFYIKPTANSPAKPDISLNGNIFTDPADVQTIFDKQVDRVHYEVQDWDCEVLNTNYNVGAEDSRLGPDKDGKKISILLMVSGSVKYWNNIGSTGGVGDGGEPVDPRGFTETIVLVPNLAAYGPKALKGEKKWLIQSQNFRLVF